MRPPSRSYCLLLLVQTVDQMTGIDGVGGTTVKVLV